MNRLEMEVSGNFTDLFENNLDLNISGVELLRFDCFGLYVPKKSEYNLRKYVSKKSLKEIDTDLNIAVEKCLIVLDSLSSTYYSDNKWKHLKSTILDEQTKKLKDNTYVYRKIIELLKIGTSKGAFIEIKGDKKGKELFSIGNESKQYRLTETYLKPGLIRYQLKTDYLSDRRRKHFYNMLSNAIQNPIARNLINVYGKLDIPKKQELLKKGKQLVKNGYTTKKGNILTVRNKHTDSYWSDVDNRSFVEDNLKIYQYLTEDGFIIPIIGADKSGGRVVDSFTLMPSWIRNQLKIDGEAVVEVDFKCLHPNIAISLYGGNRRYLNHSELAEKLGIDKKIVKNEHLSFFNKEIYQMKQSVLYKYYEDNEKWMLDNILKDKSKNGHKVTTAKMFKKETEIMSEVIEILNEENIYVLYVYDALVVKKSNKDRVRDVMNKVIMEKNVYTFAE